MRSIFQKLSIPVLCFLTAVWSGLVLAADSVPSPIGHNSMQAGSPFTDYTAGVVVYVLLIGFLVTTLLLGAFLILNLGLLSKREEDRIGGRTPSDLGILKGGVWPEEHVERPHLPAEEDPAELAKERKKRRRVA